MKISYNAFLIILLKLSYTSLGNAQIADWQLDSTVLSGKTIVDDLNVPWELIVIDDSTFWVNERGGKVFEVSLTGRKKILLDISQNIPLNANEGGLLGMCSFVDTSEESYFLFLVYNYSLEGSTFVRLSRFEYQEEQLINEVILLDGIAGSNIHNGSRLLITSDQKLLMTTGDAGQRELSQDTMSLNGKILRLNLDGTIPRDNPFGDSYVYALGIRNAQGLCIDGSDRIYFTDHGPSSDDEVNMLIAGANYGWPDVKGFCNTADELAYCEENEVSEPLWAFTPTIALNDIVYYNNSKIPEFNGDLLMAVLGGFNGTPGVYHLDIDEPTGTIKDVEIHQDDKGRIRDIAINSRTGAIYFINNGSSYPGEGPNAIFEFLPNSISNLQNIQDNTLSANYNSMSHRWNIQKISQNTFYEILDMSGRVILDGEIKYQEASIDCNELMSQMYVLKIKSGKNIYIEQFIR